MDESRVLSVASVNDMLAQLGEAELRRILEGFESPRNPGIQRFVRASAVDFARKGIASTFLVGRSSPATGEPFRLAGFFALANNILTIDRLPRLSGTLRRRVSRFGTEDAARGILTLPMPLIAQLGKNYADEEPASGSELLKLACQKVVEAQRILGGRMVYLEVEDKAGLLRFYSDNGFFEIGRRTRDDAPELVQMVRDLRPLHRMERQDTART